MNHYYPYLHCDQCPRFAVWKKQKHLLLLLGILLHASLNPFAAFGSILFHLVLVLEKLLDGVRIRYVTTLLNTWARCHALFPGFERGELIDIDACPTGGSDPSIVGDIWDVLLHITIGILECANCVCMLGRKWRCECNMSRLDIRLVNEAAVHG
jgi:hypothetical protein